MENLEQFKKYFEKFGKEPMMELIKKYGLEKTPNIVVSHQKNLTALNDISELTRFIEYLEKNDKLFVSKGAQEYSILWKNYVLVTKDINNKKTLEEFAGEEDDILSKNVHDGQYDDKLQDIADSVHALLQDECDVKIFDKVSDVELMLAKQMKKKTDKKATYEQVENLSKQNKLMQEGLKKMEETLPSNIEKFYGQKDLSRYFFYGVLLTIALIIILGFGMNLLMNK